MAPNDTNVETQLKLLIKALTSFRVTFLFNLNLIDCFLDEVNGKYSVSDNEVCYDCYSALVCMFK